MTVIWLEYVDKSYHSFSLKALLSFCLFNEVLNHVHRYVCLFHCNFSCWLHLISTWRYTVSRIIFHSLFVLRALPITFWSRNGRKTIRSRFSLTGHPGYRVDSLIKLLYFIIFFIAVKKHRMSWFNVNLLRQNFPKMTRLKISRAISH